MSGREKAETACTINLLILRYLTGASIFTLTEYDQSKILSSWRYAYLSKSFTSLHIIMLPCVLHTVTTPPQYWTGVDDASPFVEGPNKLQHFNISVNIEKNRVNTCSIALYRYIACYMQVYFCNSQLPYRTKFRRTK